MMYKSVDLSTEKKTTNQEGTTPPTTSKQDTPTVNGKEGKTVRLTQKDFYALCEQLKREQNVLTAERMPLGKAASYLSTVLGFHVAATSVKDAKEATGIDWDIRKKVSGMNARKEYNTRTLAKAIRDLYKLLDLPVPSTVSRLATGQAADEKDS